MVLMCLMRLWESSNVVINMISKLKRVYNDLHYTTSVIIFGADEILEHLKHSTVLF